MGRSKAGGAVRLVTLAATAAGGQRAELQVIQHMALGRGCADEGRAAELEAQLGGLPGKGDGFGSHWHHPTTRITERKGTLMKIGWGAACQ